MRRSHAKAELQKQDLLQRLIESRAMNGIQRFLRRVNIAKLEQQAGEAIYQANQLLADVQKAKSDETRYQEKMRTLQPRIREYKDIIEQIEEQLSTPSAQATDIARLQSELTQEQNRREQQETMLGQARQSYQSELQTLSKQQQQLETQLAEFDQQMRDIEKKIVENARVVGTTLTKTYMNQTVSNRRFDVVILDEVSMAPMPLIYLVANHADRSVTFIGDPQQLAPIVNAKTKMAKNWLGHDLFHLRGVSLESANQGIEHSALLNVQSRMHPQIARIANTLVYQNKLLNAFDESKLKCISPLPDVPLVLCDTQDAQPTASRPRNGKSLRNYYHALCCLELAKKVLPQLPDASKLTTPAIGIVTPYAPQAKLIQNLIQEAKLQNVVQAGTVHRFQGLEFDIVIFDTADAPGLEPIEFTSGSIGSNSMRLINVAVTRARYKLFIVAHQQHILQAFPETAIMKQVVQLAAQSAICSSLDIVGIPLATALQNARKQRIPPEQIYNQVFTKEEILVLHPAAKDEDDEDIKHYNEKTVYDAFKRDIRAASQSIMIASPFLAPARVKDLLPLLIEKQQQGIKITIYAKPLSECDEAWHRKAAQILLNAGLPLAYRLDMHQKAVIVDEKIFYHCTINPLSHRDKLESVLRIIKHPKIITAFNEDIQTPAITQQKICTMTEDEIRKLKTISVPINLLPKLASTCACGSQFVPRLRRDGSGAFYGCENFGSCSHKNIINITKDHLQQIQMLQNKLCAQCHSCLEFQLQNRPQLILLSCENQCEEKQRIVFIKTAVDG